MTARGWAAWLSTMSIILVPWGAVFAFFGPGVLPVDRNVLLPWESAIYGAIMMGWGTTLLLVGRVAFRRHDVELTSSRLAGVAVWQLVEAAFSVHFGVWFNVGVDAAVLALFSVPLISSGESRGVDEARRPKRASQRGMDSEVE